MKYIYFLLLSLPYCIQAQCDLDRHNTSADTGWRSCQTAPNPNPLRGDGHWIHYDLSWDYMIEQIQIWNHNHPETIDEGAQDLVIDVSDDGINWTEVAMVVLPQASGLSRYAGFNGPTLNVRTRHVLITINSNYGGSCIALGELRFDVADDIECINYTELTGDLGNRIYYADVFINTDGIVNTNKTVHFQVGKEVNILEGFEARDNSELIIDIQPCNN